MSDTMNTTPAPHIEWSDAFLLGFEPMDETHQDFVNRLNVLQSCSVVNLAEALRSMIQHCEEHFAQERGWMEETEMPGRDCHIDEHQAVLASMHEVLARLTETFSPEHVELAQDLGRELGVWFPGHAHHLDSALSHWVSMRRYGGKPVVVRRTPPQDPCSVKPGT